MFSREKIEPFLGLVLFTAVLLPVRVLFYSLVSTYWLGSVGIMSAVTFFLWYYSERKPKLGYFGRLILKELRWAQTGKKFKVVVASASFMIFFTGSYIALCLIGSSVYSDTKEQLMQAIPPEDRTFTVEKATELISQTSHSDPFSALNQITNLPTSRLDVFVSIVSITNDLTSGYLLHFNTVLLVEEVEGLTIFLVYRRFVWKKNEEKEKTERAI